MIARHWSIEAALAVSCKNAQSLRQRIFPSLLLFHFRLSTINELVIDAITDDGNNKGKNELIIRRGSDNNQVTKIAIFFSKNLKKLQILRIFKMHK